MRHLGWHESCQENVCHLVLASFACRSPGRETPPSQQQADAAKHRAAVVLGGFLKTRQQKLKFKHFYLET